MTNEEITNYAIQAGLKDVLDSTGPEKFKHFARLIAGAEQERCFNVCGQVEGPPGNLSFYEGVRSCAEAIYALPEK